MSHTSSSTAARSRARPARARSPSSTSRASSTSAAPELRPSSGSRGARATAPTSPARTPRRRTSSTWSTRARRRRRSSKADLHDLTPPPGHGLPAAVHGTLRQRGQWLRPVLQLFEREDDLDGLLDAGLPLPRHVHAGLGVAVRDQRQLLPVSVLLPDRSGLLRDERHLRRLPAGARGRDGGSDAVRLARRRYNRHRDLLRTAAYVRK